MVSDGALGIVKAIETCFPRSERQRCLAHRMRNLAAKVPEAAQQGAKRGRPEVKARAQAAYQAPSPASSPKAWPPTAVACFRDDFEARIAHLLMPIPHRRAIHTTNLLERLFVEERWRAIKITDFERRQMASIGEELDQEYEAQNGLATKPSALANPIKLSGSSQT